MNVVQWNASCTQPYCGMTSDEVKWNASCTQHYCGMTLDEVQWNASCTQHYCGMTLDEVQWNASCTQPYHRTTFDDVQRNAWATAPSPTVKWHWMEVQWNASCTQLYCGSEASMAGTHLGTAKCKHSIPCPAWNELSSEIFPTVNGPNTWLIDLLSHCHLTSSHSQA